MGVKTVEPDRLGCTLALPLTSYVTLDKLLHFRSLFPCLSKRNNSMYLIDLRGFNELTSIKLLRKCMTQHKHHNKG